VFYENKKSGIDADINGGGVVFRTFFSKRSENMEKLLISGNGKGHKEISNTWILQLVFGGIGVVLFVFLANNIGIDAAMKGIFGNVIREASRNGAYYIFMGLAVLSPVMAVVFGYLSQTFIIKTAIYVYDNGIKGLGCAGEWFQSLFSLQMTEFQLTYNQISSVDVVNGNTLIINAGDVKHKVYAMNAREIRDVITAQKNKTEM
jgi:hypothetical protein